MADLRAKIICIVSIDGCVPKIIITVATMIVEFVAGLAFGSMSLLADGRHMASHVSAMGITAFAYHFSRKHLTDTRFTFGTGKIGDLAGFSSALMLIL
jgi:cation diffusion facilitator family transporter